MTALDLLVALCETDAEETKICHYNQDGSLNRVMLKGTWYGGFTLQSGEPKEGAMYLMVDVLLEDCTPDLIYNHKDDKWEATIFGYLVDDMIIDEECQ